VRVVQERAFFSACSPTRLLFTGSRLDNSTSTAHTHNTPSPRKSKDVAHHLSFFPFTFFFLRVRVFLETRRADERESRDGGWVGGEETALCPVRRS
jgi:hypothetical protein